MIYVRTRRPIVTIGASALGCALAFGLLAVGALQLPAGWDVERVEMDPASLLGPYRVRRDKDRATLVIDLQQPLAGKSRGRSLSHRSTICR